MRKFDIKKFGPHLHFLKYYETKPSFEDMWNDCQRGDWMLWMAFKMGVDYRLFTQAKALCANTVRHLMPDKRSTDAVDAALWYAKGEINREQLKNYAAEAAEVGQFFYNFDPDTTATAAGSACEKYAYGDESSAYTSAALAACAAASPNARTISTTLKEGYNFYINPDSSPERKENMEKTAEICRETLTDFVFEETKKEFGVLI